MKKILALMLALMMALSATGALAEETAPKTVYGYITLNEEMLPDLLSMTGTEMDEATQEVMDLLLDVLNNLGFYAMIGETSAQISLTLKDQAVLNVISAETDKGFAVVSDLFPTYAITISQETLDELMSTAASSMPVVDAAAVEAALAIHLKAFANSLSDHVGAPVPGEYTIEEGLVFNCQIPVDITMTDLASLFIVTFKNMMIDPALTDFFTFAAASQGQELSPDDLDQLLAELKKDEANQPDLNVALYGNMDAEGNLGEDFYLTADMSDDEFVMAVMLGMVDEQVSVSLIFGDAIYASMDEMISAAVNGGGNAVVIDIYGAPLEKEGDFAVMVDLYTQGMYAGLYTENVTEEDVVSGYTEIYFMDSENPLLVLEVYTENAGEEITLNITDETPVVTLESLMNDTEGTASTPLLMDIMSYGLNNILANAAAAMPEEMNALITLMYAPMPIEETTTVEGVAQ